MFENHRIGMRTVIDAVSQTDKLEIVRSDVGRQYAMLTKLCAHHPFQPLLPESLI